MASLGATDEYTFFRTRYPRGVDSETGLLILSDATIRRWCSPKWRIAASRRTRVAAAMADIIDGGPLTVSKLAVAGGLLDDLT